MTCIVGLHCGMHSAEERVPIGEVSDLIQVGVPLPFISYGGTAMVTLGLSLGILMSIARHRRLVQT